MELLRNNHYIPQMYLKNWANNNKIYVYNLLVSNENVPLWKKQPIKSTASQKNLYLRVEDGKEIDDFEHYFDKEFESPAKEALEKACGSEKLAFDDWKKILDYVAAQYVRTPAFYQKVHSYGASIIPDILEKEGRKLETLERVPQLKEKLSDIDCLLPLKVTITDQKTDDLHRIVNIETYNGKNVWFIILKLVMDNNSKIRDVFHQIKWSIATSPKDKYWPTSDNPFIIISEYNNHFQISDGFIGKDKLFLFPLSPTKMLIGTKNRRYDYRFTASELQYMIFKNAIVDNAFFYVFNSFEDNEIPEIHERVVNEKEFKRIQKEYNNWFEDYKNTEGTMLRTRKAN